VSRAGRLGWSLDELLGPHNADLEPEQVDLICRTFADAGVPLWVPFTQSSAFRGPIGQSVHGGNGKNGM
jgi:hypothetical protein